MDTDRSVTLNISDPSQLGRVSAEARHFGARCGLTDIGLGQLIQNVEETARRVLRVTSSPVTLMVEVPRPGEPRIMWGAANIRATSEPSRSLHAAHVPLPVRGSSALPIATPPSPAGQTAGAAAAPTITESRIAGSGWRWLGARGPHLTLTLLERPHPREPRSGDMALVERNGNRLRLAVVDGLGHGPAARDAAQRAVDTLRATSNADLQESVLKAHELVAPTRGATLGVVDIDLAARVLRGTTIGNVRVVMFFGAGRMWTPCGTDAVLGHGRGSLHGRLDVRVEQHPLPPDALLALFSDGLQNQLRLPWQRSNSDPEDLAAQLFGSYSVATDDATLLIMS